MYEESPAQERVIFSLFLVRKSPAPGVSERENDPRDGTGSCEGRSTPHGHDRAGGALQRPPINAALGSTVSCSGAYGHPGLSYPPISKP